MTEVYSVVRRAIESLSTTFQRISRLSKGLGRWKRTKTAKTTFASSDGRTISCTVTLSVDTGFLSFRYMYLRTNFTYPKRSSSVAYVSRDGPSNLQYWT